MFPLRMTNKVFLNAEKNREVFKHLPVLSKEEFHQWAPSIVEGAEPDDVFTDRAFVSMRSRTITENCMVYVGSPGPYIVNIMQSRTQKLHFKDCIFIFDESADLDWLHLILTGHVKLEGNCIFRKVLNPNISRDQECIPANCVCSGNRQVLMYFHFDAVDKLKEIRRMGSCAKASKLTKGEGEGYNVILPSGLVSKRDYLTAYLFLRDFLELHGMKHIYSSPLDQFQRSFFTDCLMLSNVAPIQYEKYLAKNLKT